jgi:hypothetical protein
MRPGESAFKLPRGARDGNVLFGHGAASNLDRVARQRRVQRELWTEGGTGRATAALDSPGLVAGYGFNEGRAPSPPTLP